MTNSAEKLGESIKKIRLSKGMTQDELSKRIELDAAYISNVESGKNNPTLATIEKIAKALNVSVDELFR